MANFPGFGFDCEYELSCYQQRLHEKLFQGFIVLYLTTSKYPKIHRFESENFFYNPKNEKTEPFPSIEDNWSIHLSVIIPAYNEEERCEYFFLNFLKNAKITHILQCL